MTSFVRNRYSYITAAIPVWHASGVRKTQPFKGQSTAGAGVGI